MGILGDQKNENIHYDKQEEIDDNDDDDEDDDDGISLHNL